MKTYQFKHPLERISINATVHFEKGIYQHKWYVFNPTRITDTLTFNPNKSFILTDSGKDITGEWNYLGGDQFNLQINGAVYGLHLVHLDGNLLIFELHDTKQYFILISPLALNVLALTDLDSIEYYISKLNIQINAQIKNPSTSHNFTNNILPILVMGGIYDSLFWQHSFDHDHEGIGFETTKNDYTDEDKDENDEFDEDEAFDENEEDLIDNEIYPEDLVDDDQEYEEPIYDDGYTDYGGLSEEEIIYDYLESQEEE